MAWDCRFPAESLQRMKRRHHIIFGKRRGIILLPETGAELHLNPVECTLYRLFLAHPEGILADNLLLHWKELREIYSTESCYDDQPLRDVAMESLCAESKIVFYANVSRIKRKFVNALGARKASPYIIERDKNGVYKTGARETRR